jgi:hypothetical protein
MPLEIHHDLIPEHDEFLVAAACLYDKQKWGRIAAAP